MLSVVKESEDDYEDPNSNSDGEASGGDYEAPEEASDGEYEPPPSEPLENSPHILPAKPIGNSDYIGKKINSVFYPLLCCHNKIQSRFYDIS